MRVDRKTFLVTVAALAAGCGNSNQGDKTIVAIPAQPSATPVASSPAPSAPATEGRPPAPVNEGGLAARPSPTEEGELPAPDAEGIATGPWVPQCRAKPAPRPSGAQCADDRGTPGDCKRLGCAPGAWECSRCEDYKKYFRPKIAERAVACMLSKRDKSGCGPYRCGDEALRGACLDSSVDAMCATVARKCKTTVDECRGMLSGMNAAGRGKMVACANQGSCNGATGLWSCVEGL
jgi:hypothetical protein